MIEIRLKYGVGYLKQDIGSPADAISFLIMTRSHGCGLYYNINDKEGIIWAKTLKQYCDATKYLSAGRPIYNV